MKYLWSVNIWQMRKTPAGSSYCRENIPWNTKKQSLGPKGSTQKNMDIHTSNRQVSRGMSERTCVRSYQKLTTGYPQISHVFLSEIFIHLRRHSG